MRATCDSSSPGEGVALGHRRLQQQLLVELGLLLFRRRVAGLVIEDVQPAVGQPVDPVGLGGQREGQGRDGDPPLRFDHHRRAALCGLGLQKEIGGAVQPGVPQRARGGPGRVFGQHRIGHGQKPGPRLGPGFLAAAFDEAFQDLVQDRPAQPRVRCLAQGIKRLQPQDVARVDRVGVADQAG
jgi:hypothetical protein